VSIREYLKENILLLDGAMGTYYAESTDYNNTLSEKANIKNPEIIERIHKEYIEAGAKVIRTNTFAANQYILKYPRDKVKKVITNGYNIAQKVCENKEVIIACSIGPIPEKKDVSHTDIMNEYFFIIDTFLELGANVFLFETFGHTEYIKQFVQYILQKNKGAEILAQFAVNLYGFTKRGVSQQRIIEEASKIDGLTAFGFNCGIGSGHLLNLLKKVDMGDNNNIVAIPNAGYPDNIYDRTIYMDNAEYFSETILEICKLGVKVVGGCCGTTPKHIKAIADRLHEIEGAPIVRKVNQEIKKVAKNVVENKFYNKLSKGEFVFAVELDPPFGHEISKIMESANLLKAKGVDVITIADSPLGKPRLDSLMIASKIHREVDIEVMPHICCRDRNIISLKSQLLTSHVEGIRNFLLVTGDPIPSEDRSEIKSVFNLNSIKLMRLVKEINYEFDVEDCLIYGGALNPNVTNVDNIIKRVLQKKEAGAKFLLTQPVYEKRTVENIKKIKNETGIKIIGGILPLVSYRNAQFLHNEFPGMNIPKEIMEQFKQDMTREVAENVGVEIAVEIGRKMYNVVDGFYIMTPFNRANMIVKIIEKLQL
jgi:homocysteine S-methyltransferase